MLGCISITFTSFICIGQVLMLQHHFDLYHKLFGSLKCLKCRRKSYRNNELMWEKEYERYSCMKYEHWHKRVRKAWIMPFVRKDITFADWIQYYTSKYPHATKCNNGKFHSKCHICEDNGTHYRNWRDPLSSWLVKLHLALRYNQNAIKPIFAICWI